MAGENRDLFEAVRTLSGYDSLSQYESYICIVSDINLTNNTCTCSPVNSDADFTEVLLSISSSKGFLLVPVDGSLVAVTLVNETDAFITMVSDVEQVYIAGDENGGLVKVIELTEKLNNLENLVNDLISKYNTHTHILTLSAGTGTAAPTTTQETDTLTPTQRANIENTKIQHGNG